MRIGELAETCGLTAKTIRFYESRGLLAPPPRTAGGYRDYPADAARRLRFIRDAQSAGFTLAELRSILALRDSGEAPCSHVSDLLQEHLRAVDRRLAELQQTRTLLHALAGRAPSVDPRTCGEEEICAIINSPVLAPGSPG